VALTGITAPPGIRIRGAMGGSDDLFSERGLSSRRRLRDLLADDRPAALEIGFGHGRFLAGLALAMPEIIVFGVEYQGRWVRKAEKRLAKQGSDNGFALKGDARVLLTLDVPAGRLDHVFVMFPDPWWKPKHSRRRRMFTPELLDVLARALRPGGTLLLRTDVFPYLESSARFVEAHPAFEAVPDQVWPWEGVQTRREAKCADEDVPTAQRVWRRRAPRPAQR
jgi:tRNA (guanine-N7-)-methyltransferase